MKHTDIIAYIHLITAIVGSGGFILFVFWWCKAKKATVAYAYVTFLLLAIMLDNAITYYFEMGIDSMLLVLKYKMFWTYKGLLLLFTLSLLIITVGVRFVRSMLQMHHLNKTAKRKESEDE